MVNRRKRVWNDEITLLEVGTTVTENGFESFGVKTEITVLANRKPVGMKEFYESNKSGFTISQVFEINEIEYRNQEYVKYGEDYYRVRRRYDNLDYVELYCDKHNGIFEEGG